MNRRALFSSLITCTLFALASILGALLRVIIQEHFVESVGELFIGVFMVNCLGCFFFGFIWAAFATKDLRIALTGFMGSFTTFSTLMADSFALLQSAAFGTFFFNMLGQVCAGLILLRCGIYVGQRIHKSLQ